MNLPLKINKKVEECFVRAEEFYGGKIPRAKISFELKGTKAGTSNYSTKLLRFNLKLAIDNEKDFLQNVVPHEVAHHVNRWKNGYAGIASHGNEWKSVMVKCFQIAPTVTHSYDVSKVKAKTKNYRYICNCSKPHMVGVIKHRRIQKNNSQYSCAKCKSVIKFSGLGEGIAKRTFTPEDLD